ncbi:MAG: hypothetical protein WCB12_10210 [Bryobacteraceae bacterium]
MHLSPPLPDQVPFGRASGGRPGGAAAVGERFLRSGEFTLVLASAVLLAGCLLQGKKPVAQTTPAPPAPAAKAASAPQQLSVPQTQVEIPPPQPVSEKALAAGQAPQDEQEPAAPQHTVRRNVGPPAITPPHPEPAPPPAATEEPARAPIQEVLPADERKRLQDSAAESKREIRRLVELVRGRHLSEHDKSVVVRIEGMVKLSDDAEAKGDMREADALAERALVLAKDLEGER